MTVQTLPIPKKTSSTATPTQIAFRRFNKSGPGRLGAILTIVFVLLAVLAPVLHPYNASTDGSLKDRLQAPSSVHIMGTDDNGRDVAVRIWHGAGISLRVGILSVAGALIFGSIIGLAAGFFGGRLDLIVGWLTDILLAFPGTLLAIAIVAVRGPGLDNTLLAISVVQIPIYVRLARGAVLGVRELDFVQAANALGSSQARILFRHLLPNSLTPLIVQSTLSIATATLETAALGFLGLGAQPPTPEWGTMIADAFRGGYWDSAFWTTMFPGLAILVSVLGFNLLGDGLRDVLDPRSLRSG
jgi:peptide/nickel transport system permease protein